MSEEEAIKEIENYLDFEGSVSIQAIATLYTSYEKEKEKNKELEKIIKKANEYIRFEMYIDDNPTICEDEEDTITELPISLNLHNEDLRKLLELLQERN